MNSQRHHIPTQILVFLLPLVGLNGCKDSPSTAIEPSLQWRGAWQPSGTYKAGDLVNHGGDSLYVTLGPISGAEPPEAPWQLVLRAQSGTGPEGPPGPSGPPGEAGPPGPAGEPSPPPRRECPEETFPISARVCVERYARDFERAVPGSEAFSTCALEGKRLCSLAEISMAEMCINRDTTGGECFNGARFAPGSVHTISCEPFLTSLLLPYPDSNGFPGEFTYSPFAYFWNLWGTTDGRFVAIASRDDCGEGGGGFRCCMDI